LSERSPESFLGELLAAGLLALSGVDGVYGRREAFDRVSDAVDALVLRETAEDGAELIRFPPVVPRRTIEKSGYLASFPNLAGSVFGFEGTEGEAVELAARVQRQEDWSEFQTPIDLMLTPAACYPVYPWVAAAGPLPENGRLIDVQSYCFRHEPARDPARLQSFRMHENVRIGSADEVFAWKESWISRGTALLASIGLGAEKVVASDPFFGRAGRMLSVNQVEQELKFELVHPIAGEKPTAIFSVNYHQDHFGHDFGIWTREGEIAHTACFGAGLERVTLALFAKHGIDVADWPDDVRACLQLNSADGHP
jgi:seryl-tRNA synthetase